MVCGVGSGGRGGWRQATTTQFLVHVWFRQGLHLGLGLIWLGSQWNAGWDRGGSKQATTTQLFLFFARLGLGLHLGRGLVLILGLALGLLWA